MVFQRKWFINNIRINDHDCTKRIMLLISFSYYYLENFLEALHIINSSIFRIFPAIYRLFIHSVPHRLNSIGLSGAHPLLVRMQRLLSPQHDNRNPDNHLLRVAPVDPFPLYRIAWISGMENRRTTTGAGCYKFRNWADSILNSCLPSLNLFHSFNFKYISESCLVPSW